jgi:hypothetical protein
MGYFFYLPEEFPAKMEKVEIIEFLDQGKSWDPEWQKAMVDTNIDMTILKYLVKNLLSPCKSVISVVCKCSKNPKASNMRCHYFDKNSHNTADFRVIAKFKQQKKANLEAKSVPENNSLAFLFEGINPLKR